MNDGRIEQIGTQTDIYLHPETPFVAEFIGANNSLPGTVTVATPVPSAGAGGTAEGDGAAGADGETMVTVDADGILLVCRAHQAFAVGDRVLAYIRPENIAVLDAAGSSGSGAAAGPDDGDRADGHINIVEGVIDRVIFEGATAQLRVDVGGREIRADISGGQRLALVQREGRVRLALDEVTLIAAPPATNAAG